MISSSAEPFCGEPWVSSPGSLRTHCTQMLHLWGLPPPRQKRPWDLRKRRYAPLRGDGRGRQPDLLPQMLRRRAPRVARSAAFFSPPGSMTFCRSTINNVIELHPSRGDRPGGLAENVPAMLHRLGKIA